MVSTCVVSRYLNLSLIVSLFSHRSPLPLSPSWCTTHSPLYFSCKWKKALIWCQGVHKLSELGYPRVSQSCSNTGIYIELSHFIAAGWPLAKLDRFFDDSRDWMTTSLLNHIQEIDQDIYLKQIYEYFHSFGFQFCPEDTNCRLLLAWTNVLW
jgi:hypothetical protein